MRRARRAVREEYRVNLREGFGLSLLSRAGKRHWRLNGEDITDEQALAFVRGVEASLVKAFFAAMPLPPGWERL